MPGFRVEQEQGSCAKRQKAHGYGVVLGSGIGDYGMRGWEVCLMTLAEYSND
jgi:prophage DNA circulation protein